MTEAKNKAKNCAGRDDQLSEFRQRASEIQSRVKEKLAAILSHPGVPENFKDSFIEGRK